MISPCFGAFFDHYADGFVYNITMRFYISQSGKADFSLSVHIYTQ